MKNTIVNEQYIIDKVLNCLHENKSTNYDLIYNEVYKEIINEGLGDILSKKWVRSVIFGTTLVMGGNAALTGAARHIGAAADGESNNNVGIEFVEEAEADVRRAGGNIGKSWQSVENLAKHADDFEESWLSDQKHPILRALHIANVFLKGGTSFRAHKIRFSNEEDLIKKLNDLGELDIGFSDRAIELAKKQSGFTKGVISLSFDNAWCGAFAAFMLESGHGIPKGAVRVMGGNDAYGRFMSKHAPRGMFYHNRKKPLDMSKLKYKMMLVPGAILQIGHSPNRWGDHFITIEGIEHDKDGNIILITTEGNTMPETLTDLAELGGQEAWESFKGIEKDGKKGDVLGSLKYVASGSAHGSGRAVSGKKRTLTSLHGSVKTITLPLYSQRILSQAKKIFKGTQSEKKTQTAKQKRKASVKRKMAKKSKKRNRQNSGYVPQGNILREYIKEAIDKKL